MIVVVNAHKPAINQVRNDQTCLVIVTRKPRDDVNDILQFHQVLPDTVLHLATSIVLDAGGGRFVASNFENYYRQPASRIQIPGRKLELQRSQRLIYVMDERDE